MRLLLYSDLHCDREAAQKIVDLAQKADVAIGAGDFGQNRRRVGACMPVLRDMPCPSIIVPGNNESHEELQEACEGWDNVHILHGNGVKIDGIEFFGLGGGVPTTPYGAWSWDFSEEEAERLLRDFPLGGVLVSHSPPKGCADVDGMDVSRGSTALRELIGTKRPKLIACGHIHASWGKAVQLDGTTIINAGPKGMMLEIPSVEEVS